MPLSKDEFSKLTKAIYRTQYTSVNSKLYLEANPIFDILAEYAPGCKAWVELTDNKKYSLKREYDSRDGAVDPDDL